MRRMKHTFPCYHRRNIGGTLLVLGLLGMGHQVWGAEGFTADKLFNPLNLQDTITDPSPLDTIAPTTISKAVSKELYQTPVVQSGDTLDVVELHKSPYNSIQQYLKGNVAGLRSEEHTSELQSRENLVCRLLLEK